MAGGYLHGAASDELRADHGGPVGMTATEVAHTARAILNRAVYSPAG
jgi:NAD(P)H-hydrate repair Nnr-like enzyme with NAD(P)H-hydrate dehydratase domain